MEMSNKEIIDRMQNVIDGYKACTNDLLAKIEELTTERDKWEATAKQAMESYNIMRRDRDAWFERYMHHEQQGKKETCLTDNEPCPIADEEAVEIIQKTRKAINALRAQFGASPTTMTDEQIAEGHKVYGAKKDADVMVVDELQCRIVESTTPCRRFKLSCGHGFMLDGLRPIVACPVCGKKVV